MASIFESLIAGSGLEPFLGPMQQRQAPQQAPPRVTIGPPEGQEGRLEQWNDRANNMQAWQAYFPTARHQDGDRPAGQIGWNWNAEKERQLNEWALDRMGDA